MSTINYSRREWPARSRVRLAPTLLAAALLALGPARALTLDGEGPLPKGTKAASSHAPYVSGDCALCHRIKKGQPAPETGDPLCLQCHEDARKHTHAPRKCTRCHNSHDSTRPKLLRGDLSKCPECHQG